MSLMNYGFTMSKVNKDGNESLPSVKKSTRQEVQIISVIEKPGKSHSKSFSKSPSKSPVKSDKVKKGNKPSPSKSSPPAQSSKSSSANSPKSSSTKKSSPPQGSSKPKSLKNSFNKSSQDSQIVEEVSPNGNKKSISENSLPYQRIKMIMKSCPDVDIVHNESLHVVTKATEMFVEHLALESVKLSQSSELDYEALSNLIHSDDSLEFLKETIPKKITWEECKKILAEKKANQDDDLI